MKIRKLDKDSKGMLICCFNCGFYEEQGIQCHKNKSKVYEHLNSCKDFINFKDKKREWNK